MLNVWMAGFLCGLALGNAAHGDLGWACFDLAVAIPNVFFAAKYLTSKETK